MNACLWEPVSGNRRDSLGRRIGHNWWREMNTDQWAGADAAWHALRESDAPAYNAAGASGSGAAMYQLSDEEFKALHPRPLFKDFLIHNAGMRLREEE